MDRPVRKQIRLKSYDYSTPGAYFITICTRDRRCLFWETEAVGAAISRPPCVSLSPVGKIVDSAIQNIPTVYPSVSVDKYVIMPNHVHLLLQIHAGDGGRMVSAPTVETVVGQMKRWASKQAGGPLWQKSFYDHIIRNEDDYRQIGAYIGANPARWGEDRFHAANPGKESFPGACQGRRNMV